MHDQIKCIHQSPKKESYCSIFKYGNPEGFKHPNARLIKEKFKLFDEYFLEMESTGNSIVEEEIKST